MSPALLTRAPLAVCCPSQVQGPILNFEILQPSGDVFSYKVVNRGLGW